MKKILFLTGTRADFGKLKPLINSVKKNNKFDFKIFVTGMHMLEKYGSTYLEVQKHFSENIFLFDNQEKKNLYNLDLILSKTIIGLNRIVSSYKPDLIILHGDRVEALSAACVGSLNNILTCHVEGGEVSGTIDELMRHATSKLSHVHFVANNDSKKRLINMGENKKRIYVIGSPDIDLMLSDNLPTLDEVKKHYDISYSEYSIFCYHPVTTELNFLKDKIDHICSALGSFDENFIVIHSNNDPGSEIISLALEKLKKKDNFIFFPSLRHEYFLTLLKNAKFIIGNSSSGVREAPILSTPTINIGSRQNGRYSYDSILNCNDNEKDILKSYEKLKKLKNVKPSRYFGDGKSVKRFKKILEDDKFWKTDLQKVFIDK
tara:strand:+ start:1984 stop:3111 length:1128 start_codon:yes stop_codon:yes gene_type:complete